MVKKSTKRKKRKKRKKEVVHKIKLKPATSKDMMVIDKYLKGGKKKWKPKYGYPYWLVDSKNKIENRNYILSEYTDLKEFGYFLKTNRVLILI